jgi:signal peptidase I
MTTSAEMRGSFAAAVWDNVRTIVYALILAFGIRFWIAQPFRIPSSSMEPTLLVGDYIVVTKWSYGYGRFSFAPFEGVLPEGRIFAGEPERGAIVVFRPEAREDRDLVKRLIGLPGDTIRVSAGAIFIRRPGEGSFTPVARTLRTDVEIPNQGWGDARVYEETLPWGGPTYLTYDLVQGAPLDDGEWTVPEGHYFFMGDNRDNSEDSRAPCQRGVADLGGARPCLSLAPVGFVPGDHLVGPARFVLVSFDETTSLAPWTWITGIRGDRVFHGLR